MPPSTNNPYVLPPKPDRPRPPSGPPQVIVQPEQSQQPTDVPPGTPGPGTPDYGFIMEPPQPQKPKFTLPGFSGSNSPILKIGIVLGGLLLLIIVISIGKNILAGPGNTPALTAVAQQQQEMIHILANGPGEKNQQQAPLSASNQIFSATAKASLTSAQQQLITYMTLNKKKINAKDLEQLANPAIDQQLTTAASDSTYDSTFKQVMQTQLTKYEKALQAAYQQTSGHKGRKLLTEEFQGAQLLLTQLNGS